MPVTVFYSWQSDIRAAACRTLIQDGLETAAKKIGDDKSIDVEPVIDRDTEGVPGSPDIGAAILAKIDAAAAFVADVTIVNQGAAGKPSPNPNVLIELGYALKALGWERIILVQNIAFGGPELLPFDLRQKRAMTYSSAEDAAERAPERRALEAKLEAALRAILKNVVAAPPSEATLRVSHKRDTTRQDYHHYEITVTVTNEGARRIDDWQLELEFPSAFLDGVVYGLRDEHRSTDATSLFHRDGRRGLIKPLYPRQSESFSIGYQITSETYRTHRDLFDSPVRARAFVDGRLIDEVTKPFRDFEEF